MLRKSIFLFIIATILIFIGFFLYQAYTKSQREQLIFCQILQPGMSQDEVLSALKSFGDIEYSVSSSGGGFFVIYAHFRSREVVGFKNYNLYFAREKYVSVSTTISLEDAKPICR